MKQTTDRYSYTTEIKKSKFVAYICPYSLFIDTLATLKLEHPKARHFVYAYRYLNGIGQIVENSSDDGEPRGTSGKPSLAVLSGENIINTAVIIVRYFGGTKLGTGGLVRAYSQAVHTVIDVAELEIYKKLINKTIVTNYTELNRLKYRLKQQDIEITDIIFDDDIQINTRATAEQYEKI